MKEYKDILQLIKASQFPETALAIRQDCDWGAIYDEAVSQAIIGIVASVVPKEVVASDKRWQQAILRQKVNYIRYCHAEEELKRVMDEAGIPFVILKGNAAAVYYKHPELRKMGDIDFLVPQETFKKARQVLIQNGFELTKESEQYTRHIGFKKSGISFELHHHFSHEEVDIEKYLIDGLKRREVAKIGIHEFPMLPQMENGLVLLDHMRNHLKSAIGIRQIIDWMMFVNAELTDEMWNSGFGQIVREKGLEKFTITATRMCQIYLGLPESITWCKDADEELCKKLIINVIRTGNFGSKNAEGGKFERVTTNFRRNGLFHYLQYGGEHTWKAYHKHHWLKPFAWIYQGFRYIRLGISTGRNKKQVSGDLQRGKERAELLKDLGI